jgi:hypothetical protein
MTTVENGEVVTLWGRALDTRLLHVPIKSDDLAANQSPGLPVVPPYNNHLPFT